MRPFTAPTHAPEGMSMSGGQAPENFTGNRPLAGTPEADQNKDDAPHPDDFDDGLVHNHNWASETTGK